jgi:SPP1 family predicted phage head-tail adaptor
MRAGRLRHRVQIQAATDTRASDGSLTRTWATVATRWASVEPLNGRELYYAQQVQPLVSVQVTMRYYDGLTPAHRLYWDSRAFEIASVTSTNERGREHVVMCTEVA